MLFIIASSIVLFELAIITKLLLMNKDVDKTLEKQYSQIKTPRHYAEVIHDVLHGLHQIHEWNRPECSATSTEIMTSDLSDRLIEKLEELIRNS